VQSDATFCGQCGFNLQTEIGKTFETNPNFLTEKKGNPAVGIPDVGEDEPVTMPFMSMPNPEVNQPEQWDWQKSPWDEPQPNQSTTNKSVESENNGWGDRNQSMSNSVEEQLPYIGEPGSVGEPKPQSSEPEVSSTWEPTPPPQSSEPEVSSTWEPTPPPQLSEPVGEFIWEQTPSQSSEPVVKSELEPRSARQPEPEVPSDKQEAAYIAPPNKSASKSDTSTKIQTQIVSLYHVQTDTSIEISPHISLVHIGKPNSQIPPDVDVSGFPNSEIVSRVHADIRVEGDAYFIEDMGSSNGTYINHTPLLSGNRHRLRPGDRIALGKGDKVTFIFQISETLPQ
jgi:pSer/pThr/pTyr-binding forkhead associated (FHA) protein